MSGAANPSCTLSSLLSLHPCGMLWLQVMADAIKDQVLGTAAAGEEAAAAGKRVGFRKRQNRWSAGNQGAGFGAPYRPIPADRALVPVQVKSEPWKKA